MGVSTGSPLLKSDLIKQQEALLRQSIAQFSEIGDRTLIAGALVDLGAVTRATGAESQAKRYLLEALRTAIETQTNHTALQALVDLAAIEMREGKAELVAQLAPQQIEAAERRARAKTLERLAQETLARG